MKTEGKILFADRNRNVRGLLKREFEALGYRVFLAGDGGEVLAFLEGGEQPDLLVLDLDLPTIDGASILGKLHERPSPVPVIIHADQDELSRHPNLSSALAFLEKGEDLDRLKQLVAEAFSLMPKYRRLPA